MQRFTYYYADGHSEIRTQPNAPLPRSGEVWIRGAYEPDVQPDPLNVRVGEAGVQAWKVILWLRMAHDAREHVLQGYMGVITDADIDAALWFYDRYPKEIEHQIERELEPV